MLSKENHLALATLSCLINNYVRHCSKKVLAKLIVKDNFRQLPFEDVKEDLSATEAKTHANELNLQAKTQAINLKDKAVDLGDKDSKGVASEKERSE